MKTINISFLISVSIMLNIANASELEKNEQEIFENCTNSSSIVSDPVDYSVQEFQEYLTKNMIAENFRIFDRIFYPTVVLKWKSQYSEEVVSTYYMHEANNLWEDLNDPQSFIARSSRLVDSSLSHYSELSTPELHTIQQIIIAVGMKKREQYFTELTNEHSLTPEMGISIAFRFLEEFVQCGSLDYHLAFLKQSLADDRGGNSEQKEAMQEFLSMMVSGLRYLVSGDLKDPLKDPLINKHISQEEISEFIRLRDYFHQTPEVEDWHSANFRLKKLKNKIIKSRFQTMEDYGNHIFVLLKTMQPELKDLEIDSVIPYFEKTWVHGHTLRNL